MITFTEALDRILSNVLPLPAKHLTLDNLLGFVTSEPLIARSDMPAFDNSAVDGFGVLVSDIQQASSNSPVALKLAGTIQAGDSGNKSLTPGTTLKILTGAPVPAGVEAVVMREYCDETNGTVSIKQSTSSGANIRRSGEEYRQGQVILDKGIIINPATIGLIATLGYSSFPVYKKPHVAVISTGNELVKPGDKLKPGQIYDSNSYAMVAALNSLGILGVDKLHTVDDKEKTRATLQKALKTSDVIVSCGGVSVGDYDFVKDVAEELGIKTIFWKIAIKPGKPVYFGVTDDAKQNSRKLIFGLPGNPVSAVVTFHQLVKPALWKMMGATCFQPTPLQAMLTAPLKKRPERQEFVRGFLFNENGQLKVSPAKGQDSHMMGGIAQANCLIDFPLEAERLEAGQSVSVELLSWGS